jgi:cyclin H
MTYISAKILDTDLHGVWQATAVQYLKRFYITNSLMTYHPTSILKTALFFATKTENHYFRLTKFADAIGKTKAEDVLASEFLLTQGLRFTFDVRHPFRALEGAVMEMQAYANSIPPMPGREVVSVPSELGNLSRRVREAHGKAREYLKTSALLTDVYFHYTPSQIMFASLLLADRDLTTWYLSTKIPHPHPNSPSLSSSLPSPDIVYEKLLTTLQTCATMLSAHPPTSKPSATELSELKQLAKKLQKCQNPEMADLVKLNKQRKRDPGGEGGDGEGGEGGLDEKVVKKRRLEREKSQREGEELFGPVIGSGTKEEVKESL